ncbi:MAG: DUF87 domain-containing protein [Clostridia bacterium]|nr:DUF87 domain-containing protein [Clostridia bacterium]
MTTNQSSNTFNSKIKSQSNAKRWLGFGMMIFALVVAVLCIFPAFLNIGYFFYRIFGVNVWVLLILTALLGFAFMKNLNFTASGKYVFYLVMSYLSVLSLLHLIFSTNALSAYYLDFSHMAAYLESSYLFTHGMTVGGAFLSIFIFIVRALLGVVGSYALYVIMAAIFIGLGIDYIIYSRTIDRRKKLYSEKSKKELEEKLTRNAKTIDDEMSNMPTYSFMPQQTESYGNNESLTDNSQTNWFDSSTFDSLEKTDEPQDSFSLGNLDEEREIARKKLFENYSSPDDEIKTTNEEPKSAREKLFGAEPKLPDYLYSNKRAEEETRNFVNNYGSSFGGFGQTSSFQTFENPTPTKTPNLDGNILDNTSIRSSWNSFEPEATNQTSSINEANSGFDSFAAFDDQDSKPQSPSTMFGFGNNSFQSVEKNDVTFTPKQNNSFGSGTFEPQGLKAIIPEQKPEPEKPAKRITKQTNIYDDAPKKYFAPPISLLKVYKDDKRDHSAEHERKSAVLNQVFESFKIPAQVSNVVRGPKFTRYEITLQIGVPVSKILQIEKNLEMALETDAGIRIEAPIPGKNAVGIEVKNDISTTVGLRELLEAPEYVNSKHKLPVAIGKNITGNIVVSSMDKMLHALVAGTTGSGKSVFIHSLILSLLFKCGPEDLKLIIIDPKQVDFVQYNGIPHLIIPKVICNYEQAFNALSWAQKEMERRYTFLNEVGFSNIKDYNNSSKVKSGEEKKIPFIVIVVDEFSNLMSQDKNNLELLIKQITEKARAAGIHMVIATQRPSVDVITGVIKSNLPTRVALTLASQVDSKTIINEAGAEKLLGYGDMLFAPQDQNKRIRLQGAFVSDDEIKDVIKYIKQNNIASYDESIAEEINKKREEPTETEAKGGANTEAKGDQMDELMPRCLELVIARGKATTTMLQTKLSIGYSRAARIIGQMEERGFISDNSDGKPREVYITQEQFDEMFGNKD